LNIQKGKKRKKERETKESTSGRVLGIVFTFVGLCEKGWLLFAKTWALFKKQGFRFDKCAPIQIESEARLAELFWVQIRRVFGFGFVGLFLQMCRALSDSTDAHPFKLNLNRELRSSASFWVQIRRVFGFGFFGLFLCRALSEICRALSDS